MKTYKLLLFALVCVLLSTIPVNAAPVDSVDSKERCVVCGMFVAKYTNWITQIHLENGNVLHFDGVKDMMVYVFDQKRYTPKQDAKITEIWVKDYYGLKWLAGRDAFFVIGSDVHGPMGHEFVPFSSQKAAENFIKDHQGKKIVKFNEITSPLVESMRMGQKMKHKMKH